MFKKVFFYLFLVNTVFLGYSYSMEINLKEELVGENLTKQRALTLNSNPQEIEECNDINDSNVKSEEYVFAIANRFSKFQGEEYTSSHIDNFFTKLMILALNGNVFAAQEIRVKAHLYYFPKVELFEEYIEKLKNNSNSKLAKEFSNLNSIHFSSVRGEYFVWENPMSFDTKKDNSEILFVYAPTKKRVLPYDYQFHINALEDLLKRNE